MFEDFTPFTTTTQSSPPISIHGLKPKSPSPDLPPLLLLHGFPQTHHIWHKVAPQLTSHFTVILVDLRGYGQSSKPADIPSYAKSAMALDCIKVMDSLGFDSFYLCGHDRGARVAHKLCVDHPSRVRKVMFLDICPTLAMYEATNFEFAKAYFHWFFLIQPSPVPEMVLVAQPRKFAELFMGGRQASGASIFVPEAFEAYVGNLESEETVRAMCNDYRAAASLDMEEARDDLRNGRKVKCPVRALWAKQGVIEKCFDALAEWRNVVEDGITVDGEAVDSGHYIPEHVPEVTVKNILEFFQ